MKSSLHLFIKGTLFLFSPLFYNTTAQAQTLLPGDLAVIGFNTSFNINTTAPIGPDQFAIVALADIPSGTTFKITDRGWNGSSMITTNSGDGVMSWTITSLIPSGTVFMFTVTAGTTPSLTISPNIYGTPAITAGWTSTSIPGAMANVGDQVIIYQGSDTNPSNFVYGLNSSNSTATAAGNWQIGSTSARDSDLPTGLTNNASLDGTVAATAVAFTNNSGGYFANNLVYTGTKTGTKTSLLSSIAKRSNWTYTTTLTTTYDLSIGGTNFAGSNPVFTLGTLPLKLLGFSGTVTATGQLLQWQTAQELNTSHFNIQRSTDARHFATIGTINAAINSATTLPYSYADKQTTSLPAKKLYYRLQMVDIDGVYTYSPVIMLLANQQKGQLILYPNPSAGLLYVSSNSPIKSITVTTLQGQTVLTVAGKQQQTASIFTNHLQPGTYFIRVLFEKEMLVEQIIVSK